MSLEMKIVQFPWGVKPPKLYFINFLKTNKPNFWRTKYPKLIQKVAVISMIKC